jgi:hypothetical protein
MSLATTGPVMIVVFVALPCCTAPETIGSVVRKYGYREARPPSLLHPPGSIVALDLDAPAVAAHGVCTPVDAVGDIILQTSDAATQDVAQKLTRSFSLSADYLNAVKASSHISSLSNVHVSLSNVSVQELTTAEVFKHVDDRPTNNCQAAIEHEVAAGRGISLIVSILKADVIYTMEYEGGRDANITLPQVANIAIQLGAAGGEVSTTEIKGNGLYWGFIEDASYFKSLPQPFSWITKPAAFAGAAFHARKSLIPLAKVVHPDDAR